MHLTSFRRAAAALLTGALVIVNVPLPAAAADPVPWTGTVTLRAERAEVDVHDPVAVLTASISPALDHRFLPLSVGIYDNFGTLLASCNTGSRDCSALEARKFIDTNSTQTFTAYAAQDLPVNRPPSST